MIASCSTAETLTEIEQRLQQLTNAVLVGKPDDARQNIHVALARGSTVNEILDALVEGVNIFIDLHEVGEYGPERLEAVEMAVNSCLQVIEDHLAKSEGKFNVKATVGPVGIKCGGVLSLVLAAVLRSAGFRAMSLGKSKTPLELLRNSEELGADLVIALISDASVDEQLSSFTSEIERGGFKTKFEVIPVLLGSKGTIPNVARNPSEAITKATEWALKRQISRKRNNETELGKGLH